MRNAINYFGTCIILFTIRLGIDNKNILDFILYVNTIITKMTGNPDFPAPSPTMIELHNKMQELVTAQENAVKGSVEATLIRDQKYTVVKKMVTILGAYVEWQSQGDPLKIMSAGFEIRKNPEPAGDVGKPQNLKVVPGALEGTVDLSFDKLKGSRLNFVDICENISLGIWTPNATSTKTKVRISGLESGKKYWFRVKGAGINGDGPYSDPATSFVL